MRSFSLIKLCRWKRLLIFYSSVSHMYISHLSVFIQIILKANTFSFHTKNGYFKERVVYFALCGTVPSSRKFSVDKVWEAAATLGQGGNFFVPAATVISSSLNYASAEVSSSVSQAGTERERIEESCHTKFIEPRNIPAAHPAILEGLEKDHQQSNRAIGKTQVCCNLH